MKSLKKIHSTLYLKAMKREVNKTIRIANHRKCTRKLENNISRLFIIDYLHTLGGGRYSEIFDLIAEITDINNQMIIYLWINKSNFLSFVANILPLWKNIIHDPLLYVKTIPK